MRNTNGLTASILTAGLVLLAAGWIPSAQAVPDVGDPAPDFSLLGSDGQTHTLADLRGSHVVIAFFPKAFTGG